MEPQYHQEQFDKELDTAASIIEHVRNDYRVAAGKWPTMVVIPQDNGYSSALALTCDNLKLSYKFIKGTGPLRME